MAKVFGIHMIELRSNVDAADFERYVLKEYLPSVPTFAGWQARLLKGDRGERVGQYLLVFEIDSIEARNRYFPMEGQMSEEAQVVFQALASASQAAVNRLNAFTIDENDVHTDYVEVTSD